ncbi:MAG: SCO family protein [Pseudomonadota bacterium]
MSVKSLVFLLFATLLSAPVLAATHPADRHGGAHDARDGGGRATPGAVADAPASAFDDKSALKTSQAAIGRVVGDHAFTDADGRAVTLAALRGKPLVISLIYTSCYHICPTTTQHLAKVTRTAREALGTDSFHVVSIGFDTLRDTPAAMRQFAREQNVNLSGWYFASTDAATLARLSQDLGFLYQPSASGFDHLIQATVVDADGRIYRQVYGMNFDTPLLVEPLKDLVFGTPKTASFLESLGNRIKLFCTVYDPANDRYRFDYSIFLGILIGLTSLGFLTFLLVREWRRGKRPRV